MENLGIRRFRLLWGKQQQQSVIQNKVFHHTSPIKDNQHHVSYFQEKLKTLIGFLLLVETVMPVSQVVLANEALNFLHLVFIRQNNHHGGIALVGKRDDGAVVAVIMVVIKAPHLLHHVHFNLGVFIHMELCLCCMVFVEGLLPLSCVMQQMYMGVVTTF